MRYLFFIFSLFIIAPASAHAADTLNVRYGLYASGFNVAVVNATYTLSDDSYDVKAVLNTAGVLGTLAPWSGDIKTAGNNKDGLLIPQSHSFANTWREDTNTTEFTFDKNGRLVAFKKTEDDGKITTDLPAAEIYAGNPLDMLTGLMNAMRGESCASSQHVMDGKRRFDIVFTSKGSDELQPNNYNSFKGDAEICEVEIIPVAGKWHERPRGWMNIQQQAKAKGQLPRMWFGKVRDDMPAIPVRMLIKTDYGTMLMHLQSVR